MAKERFEVEDDAATRQDTSGYLKRKDKEHPTSTVPTISRAAKEAAELHATRSMSCVGPMDEKEPCQEPDQEPQRTPGEPLRLPLGAFGRHMRTPLDAEDTNMEPFSSDGSSLESGSPKTNRSQRSPKRRGWKRLSICETMPVSPSSALQIIINNPGKLETGGSIACCFSAWGW
ncbi:unnamed protein product [Effrenium voratum]|nr:unnamed protein product [Effrenium voratum]